jgi:DNA/RNA endonuclease YhcR with UshA esterase domain
VDEIPSTDQERLLAGLGTQAVVFGVVDRVWENAAGTIRFLNFKTVDHSDFSAVLLLKAGHPEFARTHLDTLIGEKIRVTGTLSEFHGSPQIVVVSPSQIERAGVS